MTTSMQSRSGLCFKKADLCTHLFPKLWLFLWWEGGGVGIWIPTEASGQVGRRLYLNDTTDTSDVPKKKHNMVHESKTQQDFKLYCFSGGAIVLKNHNHAISTSKWLHFSNVSTNCNTTKLWCRGPSREAIGAILTVFGMNLQGI